ncbi:MAG: IgGFc-binding protein [Candidatus Kapaibacterium sp.]|nr:IgGFc-binding protein [Bacteroidota bacterium]
MLTHIHVLATTLFTVLLLIVHPHLARAVETPSTYGKEFYACFPNNDGTAYQKDSNSVLKLYIATYTSPVAQIDIDYTLNGILHTSKHVVYKDSILTFDVPITMEISNSSTNELKSIHIRSDENITVYGLSHKVFSSDAFLCYPVTALDTMYTVLSSRNEIFGNVIGNSGNRYSGFVIIGTEDGTTCKIVPSCPLRYPIAKAHDTVSIAINKGQTRYINASILNRYDVSSSIIMSSKPVAVYSMHERTFLPDTAKTFDFLIEQTPPITRLSTKTVLVPHVSPVKPPLPQPRTYARIAAYFDSTSIFINGKYDTLLHSGNFIQFYVDSALVVTSDKPILVGQYQESSGLGVVQFGDKRNGDPFMAFIPPVDQFMSTYTVISPTLQDFTEHWINITTRKEGIGRVAIDNALIPDSLFKPVYDSSYYYARVNVIAGVHRLQSDTVFGIEMYGYGVWDSYGYIGGMKTERLIEKIMDKSPIEVTSVFLCNSATINLQDKGEFSSGLDSVYITDSENIIADTVDGYKGSKQAHISVRLKDLHKDGSVQFQVIDVAGNTIQSKTDLKGFTVSSTANNPYLINSTYTLPIKIEYSNAGKFTQMVKASLKSNTVISISPEYVNTTLVSSPNSRNTIPIFITSNSIGDFYDTLQIWDECDRMIETPIHAIINPNRYHGELFCNLPIEAESTTGVYVSANTFQTLSISGKLQVYSLQGNNIMTIDVVAPAKHSLNELSSGLYMYTFTSEQYSQKGLILIAH